MAQSNGHKSNRLDLEPSLSSSVAILTSPGQERLCHHTDGEPRHCDSQCGARGVVEGRNHDRQTALGEKKNLTPPTPPNRQFEDSMEGVNEKRLSRTFDGVVGNFLRHSGGRFVRVGSAAERCELGEAGNGGGDEGVMVKGRDSGWQREHSSKFTI